MSEIFREKERVFVCVCVCVKEREGGLEWDDNITWACQY